MIFNNSWQVVDLSHPISSKVPTYEGLYDSFHYEQLSSVEKDGCLTGRFAMPEHFGTHVDAPNHFSLGMSGIDRIPVDKLILPAFVIDVRAEAAENSDYLLSKERIESFEASGKISSDSAVLLLTGWDKRFSDWHRYRNADATERLHFPGYSAEAARFLVHERRVAALGIDTLGIDAGIDLDYPVHKIALEQNVYLIENLTRLDQLPARGAMLFCGALPIEGGSGSPARVLAVIMPIPLR